MSAPASSPPVFRNLLLLLIVGGALYFLGRWAIDALGIGGNGNNRPATLTTENGTVNISLQGGLMQRAEQTMKLYSGEKVSTGRDSHASILFFDGSRARMDEQTDILIEESAQSEDQAEISLELSRGSVWMEVPSSRVASGTIMRVIKTPAFTLSLPPAAQALIGESSIAVFEAEGIGIAVETTAGTVMIGEGQQWSAPANIEDAGDLYAFRTILDTSDLPTFVEESRNAAVSAGGTSSAVSTTDTGDMLTVTLPPNDAVISAGTVRVEGKIGGDVRRVRINSYQATVDRARGTFMQELSWTDDTSMEITVEALDEKGLVLERVRRTVRRGVARLDAPAITEPAKTGEAFRTTSQELLIRGSAPKGTQGIMVNDYQLQLYKPGDPTWTYLASTELKNLNQGTNVYSVVAIDSAGKKSSPAQITIILESGSSGGGSSVVSGTGSVTSPLPNNAPLTPGILSVTAPTAGTAHTETGTGFLLEGRTGSTTHSMWVNDYQLQLYIPGKTTWNYIAQTSFQNLKPGANVYRIVARNEQKEILDVLEYTVSYEPR